MIDCQSVGQHEASIWSTTPRATPPRPTHGGDSNHPRWTELRWPQLTISFMNQVNTPVGTSKHHQVGVRLGKDFEIIRLTFARRIYAGNFYTL